LIICESLQILDNAQQIGINCLNVSLDQYVPLESVYKFLGIQWSIYTVIIAYSWAKYGLNKVKI